MSRWPLLFLLVFVLATGCKTPQQVQGTWPRHRLLSEQITSLNVPNNERFDASGLWLLEAGDLLTLRNTHDSILYRIDILPGGKEANLVPFNDCFQKDKLSALAGDQRSFDCEGIARDDQGRFYICEERHRSIFRCDPKTGLTERLPIDWAPVKDYFSPIDSNASFEGIAIGKGKLYVANERSSAIIIEVDLASLKVKGYFVVQPTKSSFFGLHYSDHLILQASQFIAFDFAPVCVCPDFVPEIARDFDDAFGLDGLVVGVERFDVGGDFVVRAIKIVLGLRIDIVALPRHAHGSRTRDFAARRIGHAGFDEVFKILSIAARRVEAERRFAVRIGFDFLALDDLPALAAVVIAALIFVIPIVSARWAIGMLERVLMHDQFNVRVADRAAEVVIGLHLHFDFFAELEGFFLAVFFRRRNRDFEFGELVFFDAKELRGADAVLATFIVELNLILTERLIVCNFE